VQRISRRPHSVDGNIEVENAIKRYKELRAWKQQADEECKQLKEKLSVQMLEHGATELTIGGVPVARLTEYDMQTVSAKELIVKHPRIAKALVKLTHIVRVDVP